MSLVHGLFHGAAIGGFKKRKIRMRKADVRLRIAARSSAHPAPTPTATPTKIAIHPSQLPHKTTSDSHRTLICTHINQQKSRIICVCSSRHSGHGFRGSATAFRSPNPLLWRVKPLMSAAGGTLSDLPGIRLPKPVWLNNWSGRTDVGCGTTRCTQVTLVKQLEQLFLCGATNIWKRQLLVPKSLYCSHAHVRTENEPPHSPGIIQLTFVFALINHVHSCGQVPHLDAAIWMPSEEVAAWPGAHSAGSFTFSHSKWRDGSAVNCLDLTDSTERQTPSCQNNCIWQSLASKVSIAAIF